MNPNIKMMINMKTLPLLTLQFVKGLLINVLRMWLCSGWDNVVKYLCLFKVNTEPTNNKNFSLKVKDKKQQQKVCFSTFNTSETPIRRNMYRKINPGQIESKENIVSIARISLGTDHKFSFSKVKLMPKKTSLNTKSSVKKTKLLVSSTSSTSPSHADSINHVSNPIIIIISIGIISIAFLSSIVLIRNSFISSTAYQAKDSPNCSKEDTRKVDGSDVVLNE